MRFAYAMKPLLCTLAVTMAAACTSGKTPHQGRTGDEAGAAPPRRVCDGIIPGRAVADLLGTKDMTVKVQWGGLNDDAPYSACEIYAGKSFADPSVQIEMMPLDVFEDRIGEEIGQYRLSSFTDRPVRSIETELGKARIAPRRGLFLPVCNGRPYVTLVIPPSDEGPDRYKAVRAIGVAVEKALDEAQDCKENDDGGGGGNATRSEG